MSARNTGASCGIVALTFCSLQELCRLLRQADGPENSLLARSLRAWLRIAASSLTHAPTAQAGAASGALLRGVHHGKAFALPGAIAAGTVAYLAHRALDARAAGSFSVPLETMVRCFAARACAAAGGLTRRAQSNADVWAWLPIKRISDQEVAEREAAFAARVARATGGTVGDEAGPLAKRAPLERARTKSAHDGKA